MRDRFSGGVHDERGAVAVIFAIALVLLAPLTIGVIDIYMSSNQRSRLQDALDAAALYTARSNATSEAVIKATGLKALKANLSPADQARLVGADFKLVDSTVVAKAEVSSDSIASELWHHGTMKVGSNVVRASSNLEVSLVLDITGSMGGRVDDLKAAANDLIDIVVQPVQTPYYSKIAIVPYSNSVNVGGYAEAVRGAVNIPEMSAATNRRNKPVQVTTSEAHGLSNGDAVTFTDVRGMTQLNNRTYTIKNVTSNTFKLNGTNGKNFSRYSSGGKVHCYRYGCEDFTHTGVRGDTHTYPVSTCVSERTGTEKYSDAAPSTATVGFVYPPSSGGNRCPSAEILPLSSDVTALKAVTSTLTAAGSTAGHIGVAWGWYMISPEFGYLWPTAANKPAAYGADELLKVMVLMTDGVFNTAYCDGVNAKDSSYGGNDRIDCNATNAKSYSQAKTLCENMKAKDVVIYTVGFNIGAGSSAADLMEDCATDDEHMYLPSSGVDLQDAFRAIGQDINSLRISH